MDDPAFANLSPYPKFEDEGEAPIKKPLRKPPGFDEFTHPVRAITKKFEHIKGFKFDFSLPLSPNFSMLHSWTLGVPKPTKKRDPMQEMMNKQESNSYNIALQYVGIDIDPTKQTQPSEPDYVLTGRMTSSGKLDATFIKMFDAQNQLRINAMMPNSDANFTQFHINYHHDGKNEYDLFFCTSRSWRI